MTPTRRVLVTGVAGLIGSAVARRLLIEGKEVVGVDNLSTGFISNVPESAHFIKGNIHDVNCIEKLYSWSFDTIYHIAGQSSGEISFSNPQYDLQTNVQSTLLLLDLAHCMKCRSFVYASSMSVYGEPEDAHIPVTEDALTSPKSFYAIGKLASENYLKIYSDNYGLTCTALRLFNVYGPGQNMQNLKQGMVSIFLSYALQGKTIIVKGSENRFRDQVHIDDAVDAFLRFLEPHQTFENRFHIYNVATGRKTTVYDVLNEIKKQKLKSDVEFLEATPGDQFGIFGDSSKLKEDTGWAPTKKFSDGFREMVDYYREGN